MNSVDDLCALIQEHVAPSVSPGSQSPDADPAITGDTRLLESGLLDSMTVLNLVVSVERECGVEIPESAIMAANFRTPEHLWKVVSDLRGQAR